MFFPGAKIFMEAGMRLMTWQRQTRSMPHVRSTGSDLPIAEQVIYTNATEQIALNMRPEWKAIKEGIDTFLLYDFFVILAILTWLIVGVGVRLSHGGGLSYDEPFLGLWLFLWPFLFQPLLGVHMLATIVSPIIGKLKDRGLVSKDTWT